MEWSLDTIPQSQLFTFLASAAEGRKSLQVHSAAIAEISPVLGTMMETLVSEGISKQAVLPEAVDFDSFHRLCQFAYTRKYADPEAEIIIRSDGAFDKHTKETITVAKWKAGMKSETYERLTYSKGTLSGWTVPPIQPQKFDYSPVFIGHAKTYSVAKLYMCEGLCILVLNKLREILHRFDVSCSSAVDAIVKLTEHVYDDSYLSEDNKKGDRLRHLVTSYVVSKTNDLALAPQFVDLLGKNEQFVKAYWKIIGKTIIGAKEWKTVDAPGLEE